MSRSAILTVVILALVGVIATWSKLRFVGDELDEIRTDGYGY